MDKMVIQSSYKLLNCDNFQLHANKQTNRQTDGQNDKIIVFFIFKSLTKYRCCKLKFEYNFSIKYNNSILWKLTSDVSILCFSIRALKL